MQGSRDHGVADLWLYENLYPDLDSPVANKRWRIWQITVDGITFSLLSYKKYDVFDFFKAMFFGLLLHFT